jgi:putative ABC transport system permease protein
MSLMDTLRTAISALLANKLRSTLTVLGIVIGVAAVIGVLSIGQGASAAVSSQVEDLGANLLFVRPGTTTTGGVQGAQGSAQTLTLEDAQALVDPVNAPDVLRVAPEVNSGAQIVTGSENLRSRVVGTTEAYLEVRDVEILEGRFITAQDVLRTATSVVLGYNVADELFGPFSPVGQIVRINNRAFTVIGVLEEQGGTTQGLLDDLVIMPITTVRFRLQAQVTAQGELSVQTINVEASSDDRMEEAEAQIAAILRQRHQIIGSDDDFTITSQEDLVAALVEVSNVFTLFLGAIAGISLMVGGIGIMNIMLVSVTERTREIGLRKAVGARRRDILKQFLSEAVLLSAFGGGVGVFLGWGLAQLFERVSLNNQQIETLVTADVVSLAVGVAVAIGLFFGLYPAVRASRLDPIEALRYE